MVELSVRLLVAGLAVLVAGLAGVAYFDVVWRASAVVCVVALLGYRFEVRGLKNSGIAGFIGVADAFCLAAVIGAAGQLSQFGFLVLAPIAYAAASQGALSAAMAPLASAGLIGAHLAFGGSAEPSLAFYAQVGAVLGVGLLLNNRRIVETVTIPIEVPASPHEASEPKAFMELRESFRKLKDLYSALHEKSRRDRHAVEVFEAAKAEGERFYRRLAARLRELTSADGAAIYTLSRYADTMVVRAEAGDFPTSLRDASVQVDLRASAAAIVANAEDSLRALASDEDRARIANVLLRHHGKVVGLLCLVLEDPRRLRESAETAEELAPILAAAIADESGRRALERRARQAELLYDVALTARGAETPNTLAARVLRELTAVLDADHLGVFWIDGTAALAGAHEGTQIRFLESLSFGEGPGCAGWLAVGAPELAMFDTMEDPRCSPEVALRMRVRSFALIPLRYGAEPCGFLTAATHRAGGLDHADMECLRLVGAELGHALGRLAATEGSPEGLATPAEFQARVASAREGCLVYLEPLRKAQMLETFGKPAFDLGLRQYARRLYGRMPNGGMVCRRAEGDFVAFLPGFDEAQATSWANEAAAMASFVGVSLPENEARIPLAMRAKVARLGAPGAAVAPSLATEASQGEIRPPKRARRKAAA